MADLGDISGFMREGSGSGTVNDLDWLDVNEKDYRELDTLPKQNLDYAPDLQAAWSHTDKPASSFVPNTGDAPRTMGDMSEAHGKLASETIEQIRKVARFALMQSTDTERFKDALVTRFDKNTLREARTILAEVLAERGLIGKWYIEGRDFHACGKLSKQAVEFARRYASEARYLLACEGCPSCEAKVGTICSTFQKQIVLEVPYTEELANKVEQLKAASGKQVQASTAATPRERIRNAMLAQDMKLETVQTPKPVVNPTQFMQPTKEAAKVHLPVIAQQAAVIAQQMMVNPTDLASSGKTAAIHQKLAVDKKAFDVVAILRREMLKGRSEQELVQALKLSFSMDDLQATRSAWEPLFKEAGFYGTVYSTQESFDDCHEGADFIAKHNSGIKGIVAGVKCSSCIYNKIARCMMYGKPLVASAEDLMTPETVDAIVRDQQNIGKLANGAQNVAWGETPREALKNVYRVASAAQVTGPSRMTIQKAFYGRDAGHVTAGLTKRDIVKTAAKFLNEGLYGRELIAALRMRFDPRDIVAAKEDLRPVLAEQGLQGIYYVDPSVYNDYGHGCNEPERLFRARLVEYVKMGSACGSCVHQNRVGFCSKINKPLVHEPPYADKKAQQREILASGDATSIDFNNLVNNGRSMLAEFQMAKEMQVEVDAPVKAPDISVEFGTGKVKL